MYYKHHKLSYQQSSLINCCYMYYKHHKLSLKCKHHDFLHTRAIHLSSVQRVSCVFISFSTISGQPFHRACILQWRNYRSYFYTSKVTLHDYTNNIHQTDNSWIIFFFHFLNKIHFNIYFLYSFPTSLFRISDLRLKLQFFNPNLTFYWLGRVIKVIFWLCFWNAW
jgi:hypothetical protein